MENHLDPSASLQGEPLIVIGPRAGRAAVCPICRDGFTSGASLERCQVCGTAHHPECAALNSGRCSVFACVGRCGSGDVAEVVFALVLRPGREATPALARALSSWTGLEAYDALLRLRHPLPQVVAFLPRERLDPAARELERLGARPFGAAPDQLVPERPLRVRSVAWSGPRVLAVTLANGGSRTLDLEATRLVVRARRVEGEARDARARLRSDGQRVRKRPARTSASDPVVHVYLPGDGQALAFARSRLSGYRFLGDRMSVSATENFARLSDLLCEGACVDDALVSLQGEARVTPFIDGERTSNLAWLLAASRLIFLAWDTPARTALAKPAPG